MTSTLVAAPGAIRTAGTRACRRRSISPPARISPLIVKKMAAASGLAKSTRNLCSKIRPVMPAGMVATTNSQAMR